MGVQSATRGPRSGINPMRVIREITNEGELEAAVRDGELVRVALGGKNGEPRVYEALALPLPLRPKAEKRREYISREAGEETLIIIEENDSLLTYHAGTVILSRQHGAAIIGRTNERYESLSAQLDRANGGSQ